MMLRLRAGWPGLRPVGGAALLGVVVACGQAPLGAWYISLPALAVLCWQIGRSTAPIWLAWFAGAGYFAAALNWIVQPFMVDAARDGWMAPFALVFMAFGMALFWALAGWLSRYTRNTALGFAVALAAADLLRGYVLTGFPWALIGHIWIDTPVAQLAAFIGPSGLSLLTALLAAGLALRRPLPVALAVACLAAVWGYGMWVLAQPMPADRPLTLRLVQPNAEQQAKWDPALARQFFDRLLSLTAVKPTPDLVIWPETALPYLLDLHPEIGGMIASAANGAPVAIGMQRVEGDKAWNSLAVIAPDGTTGPTYDKHHLVPFGEYIPFGDALFQWANISAFASQMGNGYMAGPGPQLLDFGPKLGRALPLICYEAVFPQDLRGTERPDWLLQITNDAWFGRWTGPFQHAAQARLRAIEQGLPLVRVANTGVTAVYDARGRITASLPFEIASFLDATLPAALPITPFARFGEIPLLVLLCGLAAGLLRPRERRMP
ncbi:apolipoprotein N-acyltransferase [Cypionkella sp.]|uniref:apolipoprotein N-acyltransferase n=1 Tax=Cypionkella sp. TaxID=2811411 RepID=UPI002AC8F926|nr:apolipoprotein N-acyltransferase [Cypionkella sp.]